MKITMTFTSAAYAALNGKPWTITITNVVVGSNFYILGF